MKNRKTPKHPRIMLSHVKIRMSFFIWLLAVIAGILVYFHGGRFGGMTGSVVTTFDNAVPLEEGRVKTIRVRVGDRVTEGTPLVQMDSSLLEAEKEILEAEAGALEGELEAVSTELTRLEKMVAQRLVDEQDLRDLRIQQKTLQAAVASSGIQKEIHLLDLRIQNCTLRAKTNGVVSRIYYSPGDVLPAGEPILASVVQQPPAVVGFLSEYNARDVSMGMQTYLTPVSRRGVVIRAKVVSLTPEVFALPGRVNPMDSKSYRGRRVIIEPEEPCTLLPGEEVQIHLQRPWTFSLLGGLFKNEETQ